MEKWCANNYRRHLLDMHLDDWNEKFLSEFDEYAYLENLKKAHIQCVTIQLQSHIGLCNFPTKVCREHNAFVKNQKIINLVNLCRENGIKVVGDYSLIHNNWAEENHPEWRMIKENGKSAVEDGGRHRFRLRRRLDGTDKRPCRLRWRGPLRRYVQPFFFVQVLSTLFCLIAWFLSCWCYRE